MNFKIRRAVPEDALSIGWVHVESWRQTYAGIVPDAYLASLDEKKRSAAWRQHLEGGQMSMFVAEDASGIFGFVSGGAIREPIEGYDAELYAIYLMPARQRRGVGHELVLSLGKALTTDGFRSIAVWVLERNLSGVSFYKSLGGVPIARKTIEIGGTVLSELAFGWAIL